MADTKWWGWGQPDHSYPLAASAAFWGYLAERLGPLGSSPRLDSLDLASLRSTRLTERERALLENIVGRENLSTRASDRAVHSLGKSYLDLIRIRQGDVPHPTDVVVYPDSEAQLETLLKLAQEQGWILIPFGGGTSVVGGVEPPGGPRRAVTVDLRRLNRVLEVDSASRLATVECGILGPELEGQLNARGFTLGHFPQSFEFSTLGGWIATRAAGYSSTRYGKIEHLVSSLRAITPTGAIETPRVPAAAAGPDLLQLLIGSEGAYGIISRATVKLHPLPHHRRFACFLFRSFEEGANAVRELVQAGLQPAVVRLSDEEETEAGAVLGGMTASLKGRLGKWWIEKRGWSLSRSALLILAFEAPAGRLAADSKTARGLLKRRGGLPLGQGPGKSWYRKRFELPYLRDLLLDRAVMIDTLETATTWRNLPPLHREVKSALLRAIEADGERPLVLTHLSHAYQDGASLYYTFLVRQKTGQERAQYERVKRAATDTIVRLGGALSHHHGIGALHKPWLRPYLGEHGARVLSSVKKALDPAGSLNPDVLFEDGAAAEALLVGSFSHRTRRANLGRFSNEEFDLVILGGGITGAGIARDAAMRGMKVALIDKADFASGTSSRSSKMIHGGLRYLRQLDIKLVRESLAERELLLKLAPHLVRPTPHLIPSYRGRWEQIELGLGMMGYEFLSASRSIAPHQKLSAEEVAEREPLLKKQGLRGGFLYYDCLVDDARLTLATLRSAAAHGAVLANYVAAGGFDRSGNGITGVRFEDVLGGVRGTLRAKVVVNAGGPWTDALRAMAGEKETILRPTKGVHIVVRRERLRVRHIIVLLTQDERVGFVVPWGDFTFVGTTDTDFSGDPDEVHADAEDVAYLLRTVNEMLEGVRLVEEDIVSTWAGLRPLLKEEGRPSTVSRDYEIRVEESGLVTIAGGKLTTYRSMAETLLDEVVERFAARFGRRFSPCRTATVPLQGGNIADFEDWAVSESKGLGERWGLAPKSVDHLLHDYGTDYLKVLCPGFVRPEHLRLLSSESPFLKGEVIFALEEEMAMTLEDFMERRADLKHFAVDAGLEVAEEVAHLMGKRLGWDESERRRQVATYRVAVERMMAFRTSARIGGRES